jgi:hypothetical protein
VVEGLRMLCWNHFPYNENTILKQTLESPPVRPGRTPLRPALRRGLSVCLTRRHVRPPFRRIRRTK